MGAKEHSDEWLDESPASDLSDGQVGEAERTPKRYPRDFSFDEEAFAEALREAFSLEYDDAPPDYAQTLLDDELRAPTPAGYEQKMAYTVLRRLELPRRPLVEPSARRLWAGGGSAWSALADLRDGETLRRAAQYARRPLAGILGILVAVMISVVILASPAFASGVQVLLSGHTGVQETQGFPTSARSSSAGDADAAGATVSLFNIKTPISWLGSNSQGYVYQGIHLYQPTTTPSWSNGPVVDMQYARSDRHGAISVLDIREFQIAKQYAGVLQAVQQGSATQISVGNTPAVYVNGGWTTHVLHQESGMAGGSNVAATTYSWVTGGQNELIFEQGGVIFWIVGSPADGMTQQTLVQFALALTPMSPHLFLQKGTSLSQLGYSLSVSFEPYPQATEALYLVPAGDSLTSGLGAFVTTF